ALFDGASNGYISTVAVAADRRGRGIGRILVQKLMEVDDPEKITWVLRAGRGSVPFWAKMGFSKSDTAMEIVRKKEARTPECRSTRWCRQRGRCFIQSEPRSHDANGRDHLSRTTCLQRRRAHAPNARVGQGSGCVAVLRQRGFPRHSSCQGCG